MQRAGISMPLIDNLPLTQLSPRPLKCNVMLTMRHVFPAAVCVLALMPACSTAGNYERAYFEKHGAGYLVEMKGTRRLLAHDPVSAAKGETYEETFTIEIPRIEGVIEGSEIPVMPGKLRYAGRIVITKSKMKVDLYYDDHDDNTRVPLLWNGEYTLVPRDTGARP